MASSSYSGALVSEWQSMREVTKRRLLEALRQLNHGKLPTYRVMVLDHRATRVLSSCLRMFDITQEGVALVESLEKNRQSFPDWEVIYLIEPTEASVKRVREDFADPKAPRYGNVHIYLLEHLSEEVFSLIKDSPLLTRRLQTLTEINVNFLAVEENVFHCDLDTSFVELYNENRSGFRECTSKIVESLVTFCATLNEYPFVRYQSENGLCSKLAMDFQAKFNTFVQGNTNFWWYGDGGDGHGGEAKRATLIILDRTEDPVMPLLHSFVYEAMVYDLLNVSDGICRYYKGDLRHYHNQDEDPNLEVDLFSSSKDPSIALGLLNEDDSLWVDMRQLQTRTVIERLKTHLNRHKETSTGRFLAGKADELSLDELTKAIQEAPDYQEMMESHVKHLYMTSLMMHKFYQKKLADCARLEQTIVTGVDEHGEEVSDSSMSAQLTALVKDPAVGEAETARLLGLYIITQKGIKENDRRALFEAANPPLSLSLQNALLNLSYLGVQVQMPSSSKKKLARDKRQIAEAKRIAQASDNPFVRYVPAMASVVENICKRSLGTDVFPYVIDPPPMVSEMDFDAGLGSPAPKSTGSGFIGSTFMKGFMSSKKSPGTSKAAAPTPSSHDVSADGVVLSVRSKPKVGNAIQKQDDESAIRTAASRRRSPKGSRVLIFIAGGATFAELTAIQDLISTYNRDIIIGTTHLITPKSFLHDLEYLDSSNVNRFFTERQELERKRQEAFQRRIQEELDQLRGSEDPQPNEIEPPTPPPKSGIFSCGCLGGPKSQ